MVTNSHGNTHTFCIDSGPLHKLSLKDLNSFPRKIHTPTVFKMSDCFRKCMLTSLGFVFCTCSNTTNLYLSRKIEDYNFHLEISNTCHVTKHKLTLTIAFEVSHLSAETEDSHRILEEASKSPTSKIMLINVFFLFCMEQCIFTQMSHIKKTQIQIILAKIKMIIKFLSISQI